MPIVCTTPDCSDGIASIQEMDAVFQSLPADMQNTYSGAHAGVMSQYEANYHWYTGWIPFDQTCCTLLELGQQADSLRQQMEIAAGVPTAGPGPAAQAGAGYGGGLLGMLGLSSPLSGLGLAVILFAVGYVLVETETLPVRKLWKQATRSARRRR